MPRLAAADALDRLIAEVPDFQPVLDEHRHDNEGVLPHVLFGDLTRFVLDARANDDADRVTRSLTFLDRALRDGDDYVQNLVAVSFVENVGPSDPAQADFIATWPTALRNEARRQRDWRPSRRQ